MRFRERSSFWGGSSRCRRRLPLGDAGSLEYTVRREWTERLRMRTERRDLLPPEDLLGKRGHEGKFGLVVERGQAIGADHAIDLFLRPFLCGRVHQHRKEESQENRHGLVRA